MQYFEHSRRGEELRLILNMTVNMALTVIVSDCYSSTSDEHKKLKINWKSLTNYF